MPKSADDTLKDLGDDLLNVFHSSTLKGVREQLDLYPGTAHVHRKTTQRSLTRDHVVDSLRAGLHADPRVRIEESNQTTYFYVRDQYKMLVKKADELGAVQLAKTQASFDFQSNEQPSLFSADIVPEVTNLYLGYVPNEISPRDPAVVLICPRDGGHHWMHEIQPPAAVVAGEIGGVPPVLPDEGDELVRIPGVKKTATDE
jgi:hypothetical protein